MPQVILDLATLAQLQTTGESVELCDPAGRIVGHFVPIAALSKTTRMEPQISEEEIQRRLRQGGGRSLPEIMADLESRT